MLKNKLKIISLLLSLTFCVGCSKTNIQEIKTPQFPEKNQSNIVNETLNLEKPIIEVSNTEEFLEAINSNVTIQLNPGYYNLTETIKEYWNFQDEYWFKNHPYLEFKECFDGLELVIKDVDNLTITGNIESVINTEIVVEPRYATVLNFLNCNNLNISCLTIGHTDTGECSGNVLNFDNCKDINISHSDLYGCGSFGIGMYNGSGELTSYNTIIRECSSGPLALEDCEGLIEFRNCKFVNSEFGGYYIDNAKSKLAFYECVFGVNETNIWKFQENIITEDCFWSEVSEYPDMSDMADGDVVPELVLDEFLPIFIDSEKISESFWTGYNITNFQGDFISYLPIEDEELEQFLYITLAFNKDKTGIFEYLGEKINFSWCGYSPYFIIIELDDGRQGFISLYKNKNTNYETDNLIMLELDNEKIWFY